MGEHASERRTRPAGHVGLAGREHTRDTYNADEIIRAVQDEMFPLDKNYYRSGAGLTRSLCALDAAWAALAHEPAADSVREIERSRTAAFLASTARWAYRASLRRCETRALNRRVDYPETDPLQRHYQAIGGVDQVWIRDVHLLRTLRRSLLGLDVFTVTV